MESKSHPFPAAPSLPNGALCIFMKTIITHAFLKIETHAFIFYLICILIAIFMKLCILQIFPCQHKQAPFNDCIELLCGEGVPRSHRSTNLCVRFPPIHTLLQGTALYIYFGIARGKLLNIQLLGQRGVNFIFI